MYVRDLLVAVAVDEEIDDEDLNLPGDDEPMVQIPTTPRTDDAIVELSTSPTKKKAPKVQRIIKHQSEDRYNMICD